MPTIIVVVGLVLLVVFASRVWVNVLWFQSVGYTKVFSTTLSARVLLFVVAAVLVGGAVALSLSLAYRTRPVYAPVSPEQASLDRYREQVEPLRKLATIVLPVAVGLIAGAATAGRWQTYLLWLHRTPFHVKDPQFGLDVGFFVFTLPFLRLVLGVLTAAVVLSFIAAFVVHYLYGGLRLQGGDQRTTTAARVHLSVLVGIFLLLRGAGYWLDRYSLTTAEHSLARDFTGMTYTDVNAVLPAKLFLAIASIVVGLVVIAAIWLDSWRLPGLGVALLVVCAIVVGGIYPAAVQRFQVKPSESSRERTYIERNIAATRAAYGLDDVDVQEYNAKTSVTSGQLRNDAETVPGIRLLDPALVSDAFRQLEQVRQYYAFPDSLDVDRYVINGKSQDTVVAVREVELDGLATAQRNWVNDHTTYTHGFGVVSAFGNKRETDGKPVFSEGDIPPTGELGEYEPRIYFGEQSPDYSIVGAPKSSAPVELDYPDTSASGQKNNTYTGKGGVSIGSFPRQMAFAIANQEYNILVSDRVNSDSRILFDRKPRDRVEKVAPWLTVDGDPYPAVVDGRVQWILDGYTTTDKYPNAQKSQLGDATADSLTAQTTSVQALANNKINYLRNSVKATVDAYDGTVRLYAWDPTDPVLKTWMKIYPGTVRPVSQISGQLMSHLRYPEDMFKVQRSILAKYHVSDPSAFYGGSDFWSVPDDPTHAGAVDQPPYYLTLQMPDQKGATFSLTSTFIPSGAGTRNVLTAFAAVDANAGDVAGQKRAGYGKLRVLQLPKDTVVSGPGQVQNNFNANPTVSQQLNLLRQGSTKVESGNLLTLPVGGGLLYVQPVYVRGTGTTSYPLLQKVLVSFGDKIGFGDTLDEALDQVFGGNSGATAGDAGAGGGGTSGGTGTGTGGTTNASTDLAKALADAQAAIKDGQAALAKNDFAAYGVAQKALEEALQRAVDADKRVAASGGATATPKPSATPSATSSPSSTASTP
ncbi:UPF0182 family protein [Angustibacter luteus]|uniref:UPF0182 protein ACFQDO_14405 n=1 Tax=Angustibacter luteus TaxID=658456 RepID=A0ABW1JHH0_9ACTN